MSSHILIPRNLSKIACIGEGQSSSRIGGINGMHILPFLLHLVPIGHLGQGGVRVHNLYPAKVSSQYLPGRQSKSVSQM
jgi:hypothetical protein